MHKCIIDAFFIFFTQKLFLTKYYFLIAATNLTTQGQLYTCLVYDTKDNFENVFDDTLKTNVLIAQPSPMF